MYSVIGKDMNKFQPRSYQNQIIAVCIEKNSIVYLPTGSGKTFIAFKVIAHFMKDLEKSMIHENGKRTVVMTNTVCLAKQHAENLKLTFPFSIGVFTGDDNVDAWKKENWEEKFEHHQIVVATAQVILDAIKHGYIKISQLNVIVFDECHHGKKYHPYHEIMKQFQYVKPNEQPRVIGLSGMLISAIKNPEDVARELTALESTYLSTVVTVNQIGEYKNVLMHSTNPQESLIKYESPEQFAEFTEKIQSHVKNVLFKLKSSQLEHSSIINSKTLRQDCPKKSKTLMNLFKDFLYQLKELGLYGGYLSCISIVIELEIIKRSCELDGYSTIVKYCITEAEMLLHELDKYMLSVPNKSEKILNFSSPKVKKFINLLTAKFDSNTPNDLQSLVFVKRRYTAKCLYHLIYEYAESTEDFLIKPDFMVGSNNMLPESMEEILCRRNNNQTLKKFSKGETNLICCTSVLEEGIDLQSTNLVVLFDHPETYRSYVQSKGRARAKESDYYVFIAEEAAIKFVKKVLVYKKIDAELKRILIGKTCDRMLPSDECIDKEREDLWEPYITCAGAVLNSVSSISLLHRYASMMPKDKFSNVNVEFQRNDNLETGETTVSVRLPSMSKIKDIIISDTFHELRVAKRSAAFKACVKLHKIGELNDNLMPISTKKKVEEVKHLYFPHWEKYNDDANKNAGTRVNRRYHQITYPEQLKNCSPEASEECYLYIINISSGFDPSKADECFQVFYDLINSNQSFGIVTNTRSKLPKLCGMKFFQSFGQIDVKLSVQPKVIKMSGLEKCVLNDFHIMLFKDALKVWQDFFVFVGESYLIVPTLGSNINWPVVADFFKLEEPLMMDSIKKSQKIYKPEDYLHKVISPMYGANCDQKYIVTHVLTNMNPKSEFPRDAIANYQDYFEQTYNLKIVNQDQFLIQVKGVSKNLNVMFPGRGSDGKTKKYERSILNRREILIPEICHNYRFPGDLWLKATLLPCILHRISFMLLAETLRVTLMDQLRITNNMPQEYELDIDYGDYDKRNNEITVDLAREDLEEEECDKIREIMVGTVEKVDTFLDDLIRIESIDLPMDIDRNWTRVRQVDINYYTDFINKQDSEKLLSMDSENLETGQNRCLMADEASKHIRLIQKNRRNNLQQKDLIKALTTSKAGDVFDMERFEVLGDAFLKFTTSLYVFKKFKDWHEGHLTTLKGQIVSNRNLFYCGNDFGLSGMLKVSAFLPKNEWMAPSVGIPRNIKQILVEDPTLLKLLFNLKSLSDVEVISGNLCNDTMDSFQRMVNAAKMDQQTFCNDVDNGMLSFIGKQSIGDKVVADCVEAILGVCVNSVGLTSTLKLLIVFKILPEDEISSKLLTEQIPPETIRSKVKMCDVDRHLVAYKRLQEILGYEFKDRTYLLQALTHATYLPNTITECYQKLEFLGDAVLDFLITAYIFEQCPKMDPGQLTDLRSAFVNNNTLSCITVRHSIHCHLLSQNYMLTLAIKDFVRYQQSQNHEITDQIQLLTNDDDEAVGNSIDVPKVLGDLFESIVGAVFLDSGMDLIATWNVIYKLMSKELHKFKEDVPKNIIRRLFEYPKAEPKFFEAEIVTLDQVVVPLSFKCKNVSSLVYGIGKKKDLAKKAAAKMALQKLEKSKDEI